MTAAPLQGAIMVCGTGSDAGKTTVVTGLCRLLARRGVRVAPFKAQNMALNSAVTSSGHEIGRAQAAQAQAAGVEAEVAMNPVLLKPQSDRVSQVVVMGRPWATLDAAGYQAAKPELAGLVLGQLADLRRRFDVVVCEGAGSPAEINLLEGDIVNLRVARDAGMRAVVVGDIERGGVFASLYGTVALLPADLRATVGGFVINKFRGDPKVLGDGPSELERRCGVPTLGVLPWVSGLALDAEDSLALGRGWQERGAESSIDIAVIRLPHISNFTDIDALAIEPGVSVRLVESTRALGRPDLVVLPGTKTTVADLRWLRANGLAEMITALGRQADATTTILGICGGYQMLGGRIDDDVESGLPVVEEGLGLLAGRTVLVAEKLTRWRDGTAMGHPVRGYEIRHGRTTLDARTTDDEAWFTVSGSVVGTSLHGLLEADGFRAAFLTEVAARAGREWKASGVSWDAARQERFERAADLVEAHLDMETVDALITQAQEPSAMEGAPA